MFLNRKSSFFDSDDRIVLDIGSSYTKFGLSGEATPRGIILTRNAQTDLRCIINTLLVSDQKKKQVLLIEDVYISQTRKRELSMLLLDQFNSVSWIPSAFLVSIAVGKPHALVIDVGFETTRVIPVYDRVQLSHYATMSYCGAKSMQNSLVELLCEHAKVTRAGIDTEFKKQDLSESMVENLCFQIACSSDIPVQDITIDLNSNTQLHIPSIVRTKTLDILFQSRLDCKDVTETILDCLYKCPIDIRTTLIENIVLCGGPTMIPGFKDTLSRQLVKKTREPKYSNFSPLVQKAEFIRHPFRNDILAWIGGSLFAKFPMPKVTLDNFSIPDWSLPELTTL